MRVCPVQHADQISYRLQGICNMQNQVGRAFSLIRLLHTACFLSCIVLLLVNSPFPKLPNGLGAMIPLGVYFFATLPLQVLSEHPLGDHSSLNRLRIRQRFFHAAILMAVHLDIGMSICSARRCASSWPPSPLGACGFRHSLNCHSSRSPWSTQSITSAPDVTSRTLNLTALVLKM
jgi:hypothetical protein